MAQPSHSDLTDLQRKILHAKVANPDDTAAEIAKRAGCSRSYVTDVQTEYRDEIEHMQELSSVSYLPSFAHPYSILLPESSLSEYHLSEGDVLELTFEVDGEERTTYGKVEQYQDGTVGPTSEELQARVYGSYFAAGQFQNADSSGFDQFDTLDDGRADLPTDTTFRTFIQENLDELRRQVNNGVNLLIGVGIVEIVHGERDPSELISAPHFVLEQGRFPDYFENRGPELVDVELYLGEISNPDEVYFTYYGERLNTEQNDALREEILDIELFKSAWNYSLPGYRGAVGPTTTTPTSDVVRVTENSLHLVQGVERSVQYYTDSGNDVFTELRAEIVEEAILDANPQFQSLATHTRYSGDVEGLPLRKDGDQIFFLFDQVTLVLTANGDHLTWMSPVGIEYVEKIIEAVNDMVETQLELSGREMEKPQSPQFQRIEQEDWTFDTNALYHDHVADQPTSILHTIFAHQFFYSSTIHIPWVVLFEMNKHPESGSASKATNKQGFENLSILKTLDELQYLSVTVQTPPEEMHVDPGNGDVADMLILAYSDSHGAQLVTGDASLEDISNLSNTPSVNISHLDSLSTPTVDGENIDKDVTKRDILGEVGTDLHTHAEIVNEITEKVDTGVTIPVPESSNRPLQDPKAILESWQSQGDIIAYTRADDGERCYAQCVDITIIAAKSALELLPEYLDDFEECLTDDFLRQISTSVSSMGSEELPSIRLLIPSEYVVESAVPEQPPSDFSRSILKIADAENIEYDTEPAALTEEVLPSQHGDSNSLEKTGSSEGLLSWEDYLALCLAFSHESAYLLLANTEDSLWKFSKLFGVNTISFSTPVDTDDQEERTGD